MMAPRRARRRIWRGGVWQVLAAWLAAPSLGAQAGDTVRLNDRLRVRLSTHVPHVVGTLVAARGETLFVRSDVGPMHAVPLTALDRLHRSVGRRSGAGAQRGLRWGVGVGLVSGVPGMVAGAVVGTGVGAMIQAEAWRELGRPIVIASDAATALATTATGARPDTSARTASVPFDAALGLPRAAALRLAVADTTGRTTRVVGAVARVDSTAIYLETMGPVRRYAWRDLRRVERYYGRTARGGGRRGGTIGAWIGGISIGLMGASSGAWAGEYAGALGGAALGAIGGAVYGWLIGWPIGALIGGDDWRTVRPPR
jgi:hypothetical protein